MSPTMVAASALVTVMLFAAGAFAWSFIRRARERSREISAQIVALHDRIHEVHTRLDDLAHLEQFARIDRAASAVRQAASDGQLPTESGKKILRHLQDVRDELSASEPQA